LNEEEISKLHDSAKTLQDILNQNEISV